MGESFHLLIAAMLVGVINVVLNVNMITRRLSHILHFEVLVKTFP